MGRANAGELLPRPCTVIPRFELQAGERIVTEYSYKFTVGMIEDEAREAGLELIERWSDDEQWFSVCLFRRAGDRSR